MDKRNVKQNTSRTGDGYDTAYRRQGVKRRPRRKKRRMWLFYIIMLLVVLGVGVALSLTVLFKIDTIVVTGDTRYDKEEIIALSGIEKGQNLFLCKASDGSAAIEQAMPYIESAQINRKIPSKIEIHITEAVASGVIETDGKYVLISSGGKILEYVEKPVEGLPIIKGISLKSTELAASVEYSDDDTQRILQEITESTTRNEITEISEIDLSNPLSPTLLYDNRVTLKLGLPSDIDYKLRTAVVILREKIGKEERGVLDLSLTVDDNKSVFTPDYVNSSSNASSSQKPQDEPSSSEEGAPSSSESQNPESSSQAPGEGVPQQPAA